MIFMCGIFGIIAKPETKYLAGNLRKTLESIAIFSESCGKDSSGMTISKSGVARKTVIKGDIPIRQLIS